MSTEETRLATLKVIERLAKQTAESIVAQRAVSGAWPSIWTAADRAIQQELMRRLVEEIASLNPSWNIKCPTADEIADCEWWPSINANGDIEDI